MKLKTYPIAWVVVPEGEAIFHEAATRIEIEDDAGGTFLRVTQCRDDGEKGITLDPDQLPALVTALKEAAKVADEIQADMDKAEKKTKPRQTCLACKGAGKFHGPSGEEYCTVCLGAGVINQKAKP